MYNKKVSFSAVLKKSFELFFDNLRLFSLASIMCLGSIALAVGSLVIGFLPLTEIGKNAMPIYLTSNAMPMYLTSKAILPCIIIGAVCLVFFLWTAFGFYRMILDLYDTGHSHISRLFEVSLGQICRALLIGILTFAVVASELGLLLLGVLSSNALLIACAALILLITAFCFAWRLSFALCLIIDKDLGLFEAIKESMRMTKPYMWELLFVTFGLTSLTRYSILSLFLIPIMCIVFICFYRAIITNEHATSQIESADQE